MPNPPGRILLETFAKFDKDTRYWEYDKMKEETRKIWDAMAKEFLGKCQNQSV